MSARNSDALPTVLAVILLCIFTAGAVLLLHDAPAAESEAETALTAMTETEETAPTTRTETTTTRTTATQTAASVTETTTVTAETAPPTDEELYMQYVQKTLIPKYGTAAEGIAAPEAQTGLAAAYICDFVGRGTDLLVIRLDALDGVSASVPVLLWYTVYEGSVVLADTFESKLPLSGYRIRYAEQTVYISGEHADESLQTESLLCTEIAVMMQENRDMILMDLEQGSADDIPAQKYPEDAVLLLELMPDTSAENGRRYLLYDHTNFLHT